MSILFYQFYILKNYIISFLSIIYVHELISLFLSSIIGLLCFQNHFLLPHHPNDILALYQNDYQDLDICIKIVLLYSINSISLMDHPILNFLQKLNLNHHLHQSLIFSFLFTIPPADLTPIFTSFVFSLPKFMFLWFHLYFYKLFLHDQEFKDLMIQNLQSYLRILLFINLLIFVIFLIFSFPFWLFSFIF